MAKVKYNEKLGNQKIQRKNKDQKKDKIKRDVRENRQNNKNGINQKAKRRIFGALWSTIKNQMRAGEGNCYNIQITLEKRVDAVV